MTAARPLRSPHPQGRTFLGRGPRRSAALPLACALRRQHRRARGSLPLPAHPERLRSLSARRRHAPASVRQARRTSDDQRGCGRRRLRRAGAERPGRRRRRRFQLLAHQASPDAGARQRILGTVRSRRAGRRSLQVRDHRARRAPAAVQVRSAGIRRRSAAQHGVDRLRHAHRCRSRRAAHPNINALSSPMSIYEVHLGSWRRKDRQRLAQLSRARRNVAAIRARHGLHPHRVVADQRASLRRLVGLSADGTVRADQPLRLAGGLCAFHRRLPSRGARRLAGLGAGAFSGRSARACASSTALRCTSTPIRCKAGTRTGAP